MNIFTAVKYCCILHGRVCVMSVFYAAHVTIIHTFITSNVTSIGGSSLLGCSGNKENDITAEFSDVFSRL